MQYNLCTKQNNKKEAICDSLQQRMRLPWMKILCVWQSEEININMSRSENVRKKSSEMPEMRVNLMTLKKKTVQFLLI